MELRCHAPRIAMERLLLFLRALRLLLPVVVVAGIWSSPQPILAEARLIGRAGSETSPFPAANAANCVSCHQIEPVLSHPVNMVPALHVPSVLPLQDGRMTCLTCHAEGGSVAHETAKAAGDSMLRVPAEALCAMCHRSAERNWRAMHPLGINRAHLSAVTRINSRIVRSAAADDETRTCVSCHDGIIATDVSGEDRPGYDRDVTREHPVGMDYEQAGRRPGATPLVSRALLDSRIRLPDGQVGCGSCHSPYSKEEKLLVMSNLGSRLCLSCHLDP